MQFIQSKLQVKKARMTSKKDKQTLRGYYMKTLAQQFNDLSKSKCSMDELISFRDQHVVSTGVCRTDGSFSYSMIFTDCSVWGYSRIYRYDTELDNFGYNTVTEHETFYWQ